MRLRTLVFGATVGAAIAYLFDPDSGRGRRARLRDQAMARLRDARRLAGARSRYVEHTLGGKVAQMASPGPRLDVDDVTLAERIRSVVFGRADVPKDRLSLEVVDGVAVVRGELDSTDEMAELAGRVWDVPGVVDVEMLTHLPGRPAPNKRSALDAGHGAASSSAPT